MLPFPDGKFEVVIADPPWRFETRTPAGRGRSPDGNVGAFHFLRDAGGVVQ